MSLGSVSGEGVSESEDDISTISSCVNNGQRSWNRRRREANSAPISWWHLALPLWAVTQE